MEGMAATPPVVLVSTPPPPTPLNTYNYYLSSFSATDVSPITGAQGSRTYEAFRLSTSSFPGGAEVTRLNWEMIVGDGIDSANNPPGPLAATSYRVEFWENEKFPGQRDQPGPSVFSAVLPAAAVATTFKALALGDPQEPHPYNFAQYAVSFDLPQPFHAAPDTLYWVSWLAITPAYNPTYSWIGTDYGQAWQDRLDESGNLLTRIDRSDTKMYYSLEGARPPGYTAWTVGFGLTGTAAAADADSDFDSLKNGVEYVLGGNPTVSTATGSPTASLVGGSFIFTFNRPDARETPDVTLAVEAGSDLAKWPTVYTIGHDTASSSPGVTITENGTAPDTITVTIPQGTAATTFARLIVTVTL